MDHQKLPDGIVARLSGLMGPITANLAIKVSATRSGLDPAAFTRAEVPALLTSLLPMLGTLIGSERAESLIRQLRREFE